MKLHYLLQKCSFFLIKLAAFQADWCCGRAGSYALSHYDLSQKVLDRKMENLKKTNADILVTSCPACMIQLSYGIRRHGLKTEVRHISQMVAGEDR